MTRAPVPAARPARAPRAAFTLVEALIVVVIVAILASILAVAARHALLGARLAGERGLVVALRNGVEQYRNDFDALPPLVQDNDGGAPGFGNPEGPVGEVDGALRPITFLGKNHDGPESNASRRRRQEERDYLAGVEEGTNQTFAGDDFRYSVHSLPYYVMGLLDRSEQPGPPEGAGRPIDGAQGPRFNKPNDKGWFSPGGKAYDAYVDAGKHAARVETLDTAGDRVRHVIKDRWQNRIRYYRWVSKPDADSGKTQIRVPRSVGDPRVNKELLGAGYAIVSLGPDGATDNRAPSELEEEPFQAPDASVRDNIVEVGK